MPVPKYDELFEPLLQAIQQLGGSASVAEQEDTVAAILHLTEKEIAEIHRGTTTKLSYRLAWARNYLKRFGILENSTRGVWSLTPEGSKHKTIDKEQVKRFVRAAKISEAGEKESSEIEEVSERWEDQLLEIVKAISPAAFERLCQRILRESGFIHVEITGRTAIIGAGMVEDVMQELSSFPNERLFRLEDE